MKKIVTFFLIVCPVALAAMNTNNNNEKELIGAKEGLQIRRIKSADRCSINSGELEVVVRRLRSLSLGNNSFQSLNAKMHEPIGVKKMYISRSKSLPIPQRK